MEIDKVIKQPRFKDEFQKAMINLFYTSNYFRDHHGTVFKQFDIQGQHYNVLRILKGKHPEPVSPGYIKEVILDKGADLTRLVDKLVKLGLVFRNICPDNKRKIHLNLTDAGLNKLQNISEHLNNQYDKFRHLTDEEYSTLSHLLDKMRG
jgi:DNA-binding MarR family transcriptional regulator